MESILNFKTLEHSYDYLAPDGSEIRLLSSMKAGGLCHCTLPIGKISSAVKHQTVDEIWYCLFGNGEIWQCHKSFNITKTFQKGDSFIIPVGYSFQFRNTGKEALCILIATVPKWPGSQEAIPVNGKW